LKSLFGALLGLSAAVSVTVSPVDDATAFKRRAFIITRALAYDTRLAVRSGDTVVLLVLAKKGNVASEEMCAVAELAFKPLHAVKIAGLPFRAISAPFSGAAPLEALIDKEGVDAVLLCDGLAADIPVIKALSHRRKVLTLGVLQEQVQAGVSVAVIDENGRMQVVVNLAESREEGAAFGSDLLRIARVVK
jgi:hypothetical protein